MINIFVNEKQFKTKIKKLQGRASKNAPLMRAIVGDMLDAVEENFEQEGRPRWKHLAQSTIKQRTRQGKWPGKTLQRSGKMATSINGTFSGRVAFVGTNLKNKGVSYPKVMQEGSRKRNIPARPFLKTSHSDILKMESKIKKYMLTK